MSEPSDIVILVEDTGEHFEVVRRGQVIYSGTPEDFGPNDLANILFYATGGQRVEVVHGGYPYDCGDDEEDDVERWNDG